MSKKTIAIFSFIIIAIGAGSIAFINLSVAKHPVVNASLIKDEVKSIPNTDKESSLGFERSGKINFIAKKIGDSILAGEVLAKIDDSDAKTQYAQAKAGVSIAQADLASLQDSLAKEKLKLKDLDSNAKKIQKKQVSSVESNIVAQQARVNQAMDNLANAKNQLDKCVIKAPFDGKITRQSIELGEIVNPNVSVITIVKNN